MPTAFLRTVSRLSSLAALCAIFSATVFAATADRIATMNSGQTVPLRGNISHKALPEFDRGPVDPAMKMGTITLLTTPTAAQMKALKQLVAQQQDRKSANYHKWITAAEWADRFGLSVADMAKITAWLKAQGFTMISPAHGRDWVSFTGTAAQVQSALGSEIHKYEVNGETHYANSSVPQIPTAISGIVVGFRGLDDFQPRPHNVRRNAQVHPYYSDSQFGDLVAPGDIATIYDVKALYAAGIDGTGQKIAVAGRTDVYLADLNDFRSGFGLSAISCTPDANGLVTISCNTTNFRYVLGGATDPGVSLGDITEADLDLEWSGAIAKNAQIIYVNSTDVFGSYQYAIDNVATLGESVISLSYGLCEFDDNTVQTSDEPELMKANTEGITFLNSSGDTGSAECDGPTNTGTTTSNNNLALNGIAVSYPASSPEVTGVGGTAIDASNFTSTYWGTTNGTDGGTALSYIPEISWNDDEAFLAFCQANTSNSFCSGGNGTGVAITTDQLSQNAIGISEGGGGASNCATQNSTFSACVSGFPQPSWQAVTISGQAAVRFSPDVSLLASPNFPGYIFCTPQDAWVSGSTVATSTCDPGGTAGITTAIESFTSIVGGTSVSTPVFAGMVALLNQYLAGSSSPGLGNINPTLYALAATPSNLAFNPVTTGDSNVYCSGGTPAGQLAALLCPGATGTIGIFGYSASNFDATTKYNLVAGLGSVDLNKLALAWAASRATTVTVLSAPSTAFVGTSVTLTATVTPINATGTISFSSGTTVLGSAALSAGAATLSTAALPAGADSITATYSGSATLQNSTSAATLVTVTQPFTLAATAASFQVTQGQAASATVTVTQNGGFTGALTFTCSDPASESICTPPTATNATSVSFNITTTAPTSARNSNSNGSRRIFYALLLPGLLGILFTAGSRKRSARAMRLLGLIVVLGFSTMWLGSCGGSSGSSTTSNPGTPTGSYTITVNATTGGTNAATGSTTFTLVVVQ
jgi:subtilase family serine protease